MKATRDHSTAPFFVAIAKFVGGRFDKGCDKVGDKGFEARAILASLLLLAFSGSAADLREPRELLKQKEPAKAATLLRQMSAQQPGDPWLAYDSAVAAYAAGNFQQADKIWQELAARELPNKLRDRVLDANRQRLLPVGRTSSKLGP